MLHIYTYIFIYTYIYAHTPIYTYKYIVAERNLYFCLARNLI